MKFWETYQKLCSNMGKKPNQVGRELSISGGTITQWKNGSIPSGEKLVQIADYFNVTTDYLLGRSENIIPETENISSVSADPVQEEQKEENKEESKTDDMTSEFFKVFQTLGWDDKLDTMNFVRERIRKGI